MSSSQTRTRKAISAMYRAAGHGAASGWGGCDLGVRTSGQGAAVTSSAERRSSSGHTETNAADLDACRSGGTDLLRRLAPGIGARLMALGCPLVWASTWLDEANEIVAPHIGLPDEISDMDRLWVTVDLTALATWLRYVVTS